MIERPRYTASFAGIAAVAGLAGGYATAGWTGSYLVLPIDDLLIDATPAAVVTYMITNVGESAHYLHVAGAFAIAAALLATAAAAGLVAGRRLEHPPLGAGVTTVLVAAAAFAIARSALPAIATAAGTGAIVAVAGAAERYGGEPGRTDPDRRAVVGAISGTVAYSGLSLALGSAVTRRAQEVTGDLDADESDVESLLSTAESADLGIENVPPPVSPIGTFYTVDINSSPPLVETDEWELTIRGAVEEEFTIDYDELRDRETDHRFVALRCIGEDLNEEKLDTALWTGTPLTPLLEESNPRGEYVELHSADGYVSTFPREFLADGFLAYGMNGELLPREHGHPVRVLMPDTWGKLNNKWVEEIVFVEEDTDGYWEERGWESEAPLTMVAKLWTGEPGDRANRLEDGRLEVGGHAYAGRRGVERVEVSTDGGDTWNEAELADPLPGEDVTRQWRYRYEADEPHEVVVRTIDGEGNVQTGEESGSSPDGASGWVRATIDP